MLIPDKSLMNMTYTKLVYNTEERVWQNITNGDMTWKVVVDYNSNTKTNGLIMVPEITNFLYLYLILANRFHEKDIFASQLCCSQSIH